MERILYSIVQVTVYVYELLEGDVKVDKIEFSKPASAAHDL